MAINDVARARVYHVGDILCEFLGHHFVSGLRTLKSKYRQNLKNLKELKNPQTPKNFV